MREREGGKGGGGKREEERARGGDREDGKRGERGGRGVSSPRGGGGAAGRLLTAYAGASEFEESLQMYGLGFRVQGLKRGGICYVGVPAESAACTGATTAWKEAERGAPSVRLGRQGGERENAKEDDVNVGGVCVSGRWIEGGI